MSGIRDGLDLNIPSSAKIPTYREYNITLAANGFHDLQTVGNAVNVIALSGAARIRINDGTPADARAGIGYKMPGMSAFNRIRVEESAGGAAVVTLGIAYGDIQDNRASFAGNQSVQNASIPNDELQVKTKVGTTLATALAAADPGLAALIAALQASTSLRTRLTSVSGTKLEVVGVGAGPITLVASGANLNGVILDLVNVSCGGSDEFFLSVGGTNIWGVPQNIVLDLRDIFVPAGLAIAYGSSVGTVNFARFTYRVL